MNEPDDDNDSDGDEYTPTPEDIQRAAQAIRATWSESQAYFRRIYEPEPVDCPPEVRAMAEQRVSDRNRRRMYADRSHPRD